MKNEKVNIVLKELAFIRELISNVFIEQMVELLRCQY